MSFGQYKVSYKGHPRLGLRLEAGSMIYYIVILHGVTRISDGKLLEATRQRIASYHIISYYIISSSFISSSESDISSPLLSYHLVSSHISFDIIFRLVKADRLKLSFPCFRGPRVDIGNTKLLPTYLRYLMILSLRLIGIRLTHTFPQPMVPRSLLIHQYRICSPHPPRIAKAASYDL